MFILLLCSFLCILKNIISWHKAFVSHFISGPCLAGLGSLEILIWSFFAPHMCYKFCLVSRHFDLPGIFWSFGISTFWANLTSWACPKLCIISTFWANLTSWAWPNFPKMRFSSHNSCHKWSNLVETFRKCSFYYFEVN